MEDDGFNRMFTASRRARVLLIVVASGFTFVVAFCFIFVRAPDHPTNIALNRQAQKRLALAVSERDWGMIVELLGTPMETRWFGPHASTFVAEDALEVLTKGGPEATSAVLATGLTNREPQVRSMSMMALGLIGDKSVVPNIIDRLSVEHEPTVLVNGAEALCELGRSQEAEPFLLEVLEAKDTEIIECHAQWTTRSKARLLMHRYKVLPVRK